MTKSATYDRKLMPRKIRDPDQDKIEIFFCPNLLFGTRKRLTNLNPSYPITNPNDTL